MSSSFSVTYIELIRNIVQQTKSKQIPVEVFVTVAISALALLTFRFDECRFDYQCNFWYDQIHDRISHIVIGSNLVAALLFTTITAEVLVVNINKFKS